MLPMKLMNSCLIRNKDLNRHFKVCFKKKKAKKERYFVVVYYFLGFI
jgi:hypothetical protein